MLQAQDLGLRLGGAVVLESVSLCVKPGLVTAIIGPNGAGKSSLLACLAGLRVPDAGEVRLDEAALAAVPARRRAQRIGFLPQVAEVNWEVDVATLIGLGRLPHLQTAWAHFGPGGDDAAAIEAAMAATDTTRLARRAVNTLSGGERARVLLARVLAGRPDYLLADEPLANLDPGHQFDSLACLRAAAEAGAGVAIVLHDLAHALRIADTVLLLDRGRVVADGTPDAVLTPEWIADVYGVASARVALPGGLVITGRC
jgi:iron complex transport system ATP-binding protein